jgi:hypothetical protein
LQRQAVGGFSRKVGGSKLTKTGEPVRKRTLSRRGARAQRQLGFGDDLGDLLSPLACAPNIVRCYHESQLKIKIFLACGRAIPFWELLYAAITLLSRFLSLLQRASQKKPIPVTASTREGWTHLSSSASIAFEEFTLLITLLFFQCDVAGKFGEEN